MFHAKGMAGAKALRQACRGRPAWLAQSEPCLRTIWGLPSYRERSERVPGRENGMHEGLRRETSSFCFSKHFTLSDPQNKAVKARG